MKIKPFVLDLAVLDLMNPLREQRTAEVPGFALEKDLFVAADELAKPKVAATTLVGAPAAAQALASLDPRVQKVLAATLDALRGGITPQQQFTLTQQLGIIVAALSACQAALQSGRLPPHHERLRCLDALAVLDNDGLLERFVRAGAKNAVVEGLVPQERVSEPVLASGFGFARAALAREREFMSHPDYKSWDEWALALPQRVSDLRTGEAGGGFGVSQFWSELNALTGLTMTTGNQITPLADGDFFPRVLDLVTNSEGPVALSYWAILDDTSGNRLTDAIMDRQAKGRMTYVMVDSDVMEEWPEHGAKNIARLQQAAKQGSLGVVRWRDPQHEASGLHVKMAMGPDAMIFGDKNIGVKYTWDEGAAWSGVNTLVRGPVVRQGWDAFCREYNAARVLAPAVAPRMGTDVLPSVSSFAQSRAGLLMQRPGEPQPLMTLTLKILDAAQHSVQIRNGYFIMTPVMEAGIRAYLVRRKHEGIAELPILEVLTNSNETIDLPSMGTLISRSGQRLLQIAEELGLPPGAVCFHSMKKAKDRENTAHEKQLLADGQLRVDKTENEHPRSAFEVEAALVMDDKDAAAQAKVEFDATVKTHATTYTASSEMALQPPGWVEMLLLMFYNNA